MKRSPLILLSFFVLAMISCTSEEVMGPAEEMDEVEELKPAITLNVEYQGDIPIDDKVDMILYHTINEEQSSYDARIERRGGFSIIYPKHSYEIDLDEDISLGGLPEDDDWILNANYIDKTFLRHVFSYDLFNRMDENNLVSQTQYCEIELNGEYNGLYVLMEKLDKSSLNIDGSDPEAVIFKEPHIFRESYNDVIPQDPENFHQQTYPKIDDEDKTNFLDSVRNIILNSNDSIFENEITELFDLDNIIDWHLLLLISNNNDGIVKNFYLYKTDAQTPIRIAPWDYDHSFGRDGDNELNLDERPLNIERSILFKRLLENEWYTSRLKERWEELNESDLLSKDGIQSKIRDKGNSIRNLAEKNFELWSVAESWYYDSNSFDDELNIIYQFINLRHDRLSNYFESL